MPHRTYSSGKAHARACIINAHETDPTFRPQIVLLLVLFLEPIDDEEEDEDEWPINAAWRFTSLG